MVLSLESNIIILGFLVLLSGFFSSAELAIFSISKLKMRKLLSEGRRNSKLLSEMKSRPNELLTTILIGNNLVNVAAASVATVLAISYFPSEIGIAIATGAITFVLLVFGEITPKSLALKHNEFIALNAVPIIKFLSFIFSPVIFVLGKITGFFVTLVGGEAGEQILTEDEVKRVVALGAEEGAIKKEEKEMIHRIFNLNDITVEDVMTPRSEILGIAAGTKVKAIDKKTLETYSRLPVYKDDLDEIVGIFYIRDFLGSQGKGNTAVVVDKFARKPLYVYANKKIDKLLKEFQRKKTHIAIVVDEYGGTIGLVTLEDILEEIVGEIYDENEEDFVMKKLKNNEFLVEGSFPLEKLNKKLGSSFRSDEFDTIGGFLIEAMDRIPKPKDEITVSALKFVVEKMDGPKIELVRIVK